MDAPAILAGCTIDIVGVPIHVGASDERRAEAVASLFRHATPTADAPRCALSFRARDVDLPATEPGWSGSYADLWRPSADVLCVRSHEGLSARSTSDEIVVGGDAAALARAFRAVCFLALTHLLAQHGRHLLHAGAVVREGRALLVVGDTGAGKSTLVYAAHRLGWPVLSDDVIALEQRGDAVWALGLPRPVSVPRDVLADPVAGGRPVPEDPRERTELPAGTLTTRAVPVVGTVVLGAANAQQSGIEPRAATEVLRDVLRASPSLAHPDRRPAVFAIAGVVARLPAWSLPRGPDPRSALDHASRLLATVGRLLADLPQDRS